jgi:hypothetical protein
VVCFARNDEGNLSDSAERAFWAFLLRRFDASLSRALLLERYVG